jgi:crotonobetainyl-CoA:carnitine CoA-transferase CaiB-like acyl-CoA transferase
MYPLLEGVRILDLTRLIHAGYATRVLADLGADVIKIEAPGVGDYLRGLPPFQNGISAGYLALNRNKRSVSLNVKSDRGRELFFELLRGADAVVQVSKPGTFAKLGLDYESLRQVKADIVYTEISAFGQTGPWRMMPAHGYNMMATTRHLEIEFSDSGRPEFASNSGIRGNVGFGATAALATVAALLRRSRTGEGQYLDVSLWDESIHDSLELADHLNGVLPMMTALDVRHAPRYNVYGTSDDQVVFVGAIEPHFWRNLCRVLDREEWIPRARFDLPMDHGNYDVELRDMIQQVIATKPLDEWMALFLANDVPASPVLLTDEAVVTSEHMLARDMIVEVEHPAYGVARSFRPGFTMPGEHFDVRWAPPLLGEHTDEVLGELGLDADDLAKLRADGVI